VITTKSDSEVGVRQIKKAFEKIINKLNYQLMIGEIKNEIITKEFIDSCLVSKKSDDKYHFMYI
jgi:hypothetical protein